MTRIEAITAINDLAWRLVDLLEDHGIDDTSPAKVADQALKALGVAPGELDAGLAAPAPAPAAVQTVSP